MKLAVGIERQSWQKNLVYIAIKRYTLYEVVHAKQVEELLC